MVIEVTHFKELPEPGAGKLINVFCTRTASLNVSLSLTPFSD